MKLVSVIFDIVLDPLIATYRWLQMQ